MFLWGWKRIQGYMKEQGIDVAIRTVYIWADQYHWPMRRINKTPVIDVKAFQHILETMNTQKEIKELPEKDNSSN